MYCILAFYGVSAFMYVKERKKEESVESECLAGSNA